MISRLALWLFVVFGIATYSDASDGITLADVHTMEVSADGEILEAPKLMAEAAEDSLLGDDGSLAAFGVPEAAIDTNSVSDTPCVLDVEPYSDGMEYLMNICLGDACFKALFDTGSFELVVETSSCVGCAAKYYNANESPTNVVDTKSGYNKITYGSGTVIVEHMWDMLSIPGCDNPDINDKMTGFEGIMKIINLQMMRSDKFLSAIFGTGPGPSLRMFSSAPPSTWTMVGYSRFEVCLAGWENGVYAGGKVTLQAPKRSVQDGWKNINMLGQTTWGVALNSVILGDQHWNGLQIQLSDQKLATILDTGTSTLMLPSSVIKNFQAYLDSKGLETCDQLHDFPVIKLQLGDDIYEIEPVNYIAVVNNNNFDEEGGGEFSEYYTDKEDAWRQLKEWLPMKMYPMKKANFAEMSEQEASLARQNQQTCMLLVDSSDGMGETQYGPLTIVGMPFFRSYVAHFQLSVFPWQRKIMTAPAGPGCEPDLSGATSSTRFGFNLPWSLAEKTQKPHEATLESLLAVKRKHKHRQTISAEMFTKENSF